MVDDLSTSGRLLGKNKVEVKAMLGPPEIELPDHWSYKVDIGHRLVSSPWYYYLGLAFDSEEKVDSVELKD
jgi:hypothetical protein